MSNLCHQKLEMLDRLFFLLCVFMLMILNVCPLWRLSHAVASLLRRMGLRCRCVSNDGLAAFQTRPRSSIDCPPCGVIKRHTIDCFWTRQKREIGISTHNLRKITDKKPHLPAVLMCDLPLCFTHSDVSSISIKEASDLSVNEMRCRHFSGKPMTPSKINACANCLFQVFAQSSSKIWALFCFHFSILSMFFPDDTIDSDRQKMLQATCLLPAAVLICFTLTPHILSTRGYSLSFFLHAPFVHAQRIFLVQNTLKTPHVSPTRRALSKLLPFSNDQFNAPSGWSSHGKMKLIVAGLLFSSASSSWGTAVGLSTNSTFGELPPFASFGFTKATILSGDLTSCIPSPNVSDCTGGLASARFVFRNLTQNLKSAHTEFIPSLDKDTAFVQMHPYDYTVNIVVMRALGIHHYFAEPAIIPDKLGRKNFSLFYNDDVHMLQANINVPASDDWFGSIDREALYFGNAVGLAIVGQSVHANALPSYSVLPAVMRHLRKRAKAVLLVNNDASTAGVDLLERLKEDTKNSEEVLSTGDLSALLPHVLLDLTATSAGPCRQFTPSTAYCPSPGGVGTANVVHLYLDPTNTSFLGAVVETPSITGLYNSPNLDAQYYEEQAVLKVEAMRSSEFDPIVGNTTAGGGMPSGGWWDGTYPCYAGECGQATLNARALLYYTKGEADIAISNSGGYRGMGWPEGPIRMSHIWQMIPYANRLVLARVLGLKIWELMNISLFYFPNHSSFSPLNERFMLGDGYEVDFDATKPQFTDRLLAVRIRNKATGLFEPLVRTKYYTLITDNFVYQLMPVVSTILQNLHRGESIVFPYGPDLRQVVLGNYLRDHSPYNKIYNNHIKFDLSGSRQPTDWMQDAQSCTSASSYWDDGIKSCIYCENGLVANEQRDGCMPRSERFNFNVIVAVAVPVGFVFIAIFVLSMIVLEIRRRRSVRNIDAAPKSGDEITIVFTDIQSSTKIWGTTPASMADALETHHRVIRECISEYGCYEVKTIGDSFMIASKSVEKAVLLCLKIQKDLWAQSWPVCINHIYDVEGTVDEAELLDLIDDEPSDRTNGKGKGSTQRSKSNVQNGANNAFGFLVNNKKLTSGANQTEDSEMRIAFKDTEASQASLTGNATATDTNSRRGILKSSASYSPSSMCVETPHNGLRVRIGMCTGAAEASLDHITKGYDYYGPAVNLASRVEAAAQGGQILVPADTASLLSQCQAFSPASPTITVTMHAADGTNSRLEEASTIRPQANNSGGKRELAFTLRNFAQVRLQGISGFTDLREVVPVRPDGCVEGANDVAFFERDFNVVGIARKALVGSDYADKPSPMFNQQNPDEFSHAGSLHFEQRSEVAGHEGLTDMMSASGQHSQQPEETASNATRSVGAGGQPGSATIATLTTAIAIGGVARVNYPHRGSPSPSDMADSTVLSSIQNNFSNSKPKDTVHLCSIVLNTSLRLLDPRERERILKLLANVWRVEEGPHSVSDKTKPTPLSKVELIAGRVFSSVQREMKRAKISIVSVGCENTVIRLPPKEPIAAIGPSSQESGQLAKEAPSFPPRFSEISNTVSPSVLPPPTPPSLVAEPNECPNTGDVTIAPKNNTIHVSFPEVLSTPTSSRPSPSVGGARSSARSFEGPRSFTSAGDSSRKVSPRVSTASPFKSALPHFNIPPFNAASGIPSTPEADTAQKITPRVVIEEGVEADDVHSFGASASHTKRSSFVSAPLPLSNPLSAVPSAKTERRSLGSFPN